MNGRLPSYPQYSLKTIEENVHCIDNHDIVDTFHYYGNNVDYINPDRVSNILLNTYFQDYELELIISSLSKGYLRARSEIKLYEQLGKDFIPSELIHNFESYGEAYSFATKFYNDMYSDK